MAYIGASGALTNQAVSTDVFSGNGSNTVFTLSRTVYNTRDIEVVVNNVQQNPFDSSYSVSGQTLTLSGAPSTGANNIYVIYQAGVIGVMAPTDNSVTANSILNSAVTAAKLHTTAITDKLGYTPANKAGDTFTGAATFANTVTVANSGVTFGDASIQTTAASGFGFKNRIINGAMMIDQRNTGNVVISGHQTTTFGVDRFNTYKDNTSAVVTMQRTTVAPPGFSHSLLVKPTTGSAPTVAQELQLRHSIEGFNVADFNWGTANAVDIVLSFWVRSSLVGTFAVGVQSYGSGTTYVTTYAITQTDTWERKTISIPKVTTGTWAVDNMPTMNLIWDLGGGSNYNTTANTWTSGNYYTTTGTTKLVATTNATFYITGVQLEKGTAATSFDYRPYGQELALCQRYYEKSFPIGTAPYNTAGGFEAGMAVGMCTNRSGTGTTIPFSVRKRASPTFTLYGNSSGYWFYQAPNGTVIASGNVGIGGASESAFSVTQQVVDGTAIFVGGHWTASAEI